MKNEYIYIVTYQDDAGTNHLFMNKVKAYYNVTEAFIFARQVNGTVSEVEIF